jgi:hypothetical protein
MPKVATEKLVLVSPPRARVVLFETQASLLPDSPAIYRYATAHNVIFEKHTWVDGRVCWYKVKQ